MIKQLIKINNEIFEEGDVLKVTIENEGTKNVYIGKFLYFKTKKVWSFKEALQRRCFRLLVFRNHTLCTEGILELLEEEITNIKKMECIKK